MRSSILIDNDIRFGPPHIKGTRISVADILGYLAAGDNVDAIVAQFPELTRDSVRDAVSYASDILNVSTTTFAPHEAIAR